MSLPAKPTRYRQAGFTVVELMVTFAVIALLLAILLPALSAVRSRARHTQCLNRLRQIGVSQHAYVDAHGAFPTGSTGSGSSLAGLTKLTQLMANDPSALICPADRRGAEALLDPSNARCYQQNDGTSFGNTPPNGFRTSYHKDSKPSEFTDGLSQTAAVSERLFVPFADHELSETQLLADRLRYIWYVPGPFPDEIALAAACQSQRTMLYPMVSPLVARGGVGYDHILPPNQVGCLNGSPADRFLASSFFPASSEHGGYVNVLYADGSARSISDSIDKLPWRAMGTGAGQEHVAIEF